MNDTWPDGHPEHNLHFHDLRSTAATNFYRANFTIREIAEILGRKEERIERLIDRYVKRDEILRDRIRRFSGPRREQKLEPLWKTTPYTDGTHIITC